MRADNKDSSWFKAYEHLPDDFFLEVGRKISKNKVAAEHEMKAGLRLSFPYVLL